MSVFWNENCRLPLNTRLFILFAFAVKMAVLIAKTASLRRYDDNKIQMVRGIARDGPGFPKRRKLMLSCEDEEEDDRITILKGEETSDDVKLCQEMEISTGTNLKKPRSGRSSKRTMENRTSSVELIDLGSSVTKMKIVSKKTRSKCLDGRGSSKRHPNLSNKKKDCVLQEESEEEEDSPGSSSMTKSAINQERTALDFDVSMDRRNPKDCRNVSKQKKLLQNECRVDKGTREGEKMRKDIGDMKKLNTRRTTGKAQIQNLQKRRTSVEQNSEKNCDGSSRKKVPVLAKFFTNGNGDENDEDWCESMEKPRPSTAQTDVPKNEEFDISDVRRMSVRRRCASHRKFGFESNYFVGDWLDDEEDMVLSIDESSVSSYSSYATKGSSKSNSVHKKGSNKDMKRKQNDAGKRSSINSSPSSSSSSWKSASNCDRKSMDRSTNRHIKVSPSFGPLIAFFLDKELVLTEKFQNQVEKKHPVKCHQCQRNDRLTVVPCTKCKEKVYCIQCIKQW